MQLTKTERLILSNQYRILEKLYPDEAEQFAIHRTAIENGFAPHYEPEFLDDELSEEGCREVRDILEMHQQLKTAYERLDDISDVEQYLVKFEGFDGNNESKQLRYAQYFINELGRYPELDANNSHALSLDRYRKMLQEWNASSDKRQLTKEDIVRIIKAHNIKRD